MNLIDLNLIISQTISGIIVNLPWFILIWLGFRLIAKEIKIGVQNIPHWINEYHKLKLQQTKLDWARRV